MQPPERSASPIARPVDANAASESLPGRLSSTSIASARESWKMMCLTDENKVDHLEGKNLKKKKKRKGKKGRNVIAHNENKDSQTTLDINGSHNKGSLKKLVNFPTELCQFDFFDRGVFWTLL